VAITVVLVLLAVGVVTTVAPGLRVCRDQVAQTGDAGVVTVCEPLFGEVALLALSALLVVLILLPLLSKFDIAGLVSIELKADQARKEAGEAKASAEEVKRNSEQLAAVQADLKDVQDQVLARLLVQPSDTEFDRRVAKLDATEVSAADSAAGDARRGLLTANLFRLADELEAYVRMGFDRNARSHTLNAISGWRKVYALEIEQVRAVRNRVGRGAAVETAELERAVELADRLLLSIRNTLDRLS
jgi:hypothetical protein